MRKILGTGVLIVGVTALGLWGRGDHAQRMEDRIAFSASPANMARTVHPIMTQVSGRDIFVKGIANSEAERDSILAGFNKVNGRRVVIDELKVLEAAAPYVLSGTKDADTTSYSGNTPTEAARSEFAEFIGEDAQKLALAAGLPDSDWIVVAGKGVAALSKLNSGTLEIRDRMVTLAGIAADPKAAAEARSELALLPKGYTTDTSLEVLDDGKPAEVTFVYHASEGSNISGKAPAGLSMEKLADAVGFGGTKGTLRDSDYDGGDAITSKLATIGIWLPFFETATVTASENEVSIVGLLIKGADLGLVSQSLREELGTGAMVAVGPVRVDVIDGTERTNTATGIHEFAYDGFWMPVVNFTASKDTCQENTAAIVEGTNINFVTGSARLGPKAISVINVLSSTLRQCLDSGDLYVEVGGHTDNQGNASFNLGLSNERAIAVATALTQRGISRSAMLPRAFGETDPIATNDTEEGRAENRRTTFVWIEK